MKHHLLIYFLLLMSYVCFKGCPREKTGFPDLNRLRLHQSKCKYARTGFQQNLVAAKCKITANVEEAASKVRLAGQHQAEVAEQQRLRELEAETSFHPEVENSSGNHLEVCLLLTKRLSTLNRIPFIS